MNPPTQDTSAPSSGTSCAATSGAGAAMGALLALAVPADAQHVPDYLLLARICVHEAGWEAEADCAAIHEVLTAGAEREDLSYRTYAYNYAGRALRGETSRAWVANLREDGREPEGWPETTLVRDGDAVSVRPHAPWSMYRDRWLGTIAIARRVIAGEIAARCAEPVHDWGGRVDRGRARRLGLVEVECGDTRNDFYARPALRAAPRASAADGEPDAPN